MRIKIKIEFILNFGELIKFFDFKPGKALTTLQPKVTIEKITDGYKA